MVPLGGLFTSWSRVDSAHTIASLELVWSSGGAAESQKGIDRAKYFVTYHYQHDFFTFSADH